MPRNRRRHRPPKKPRSSAMPAWPGSARPSSACSSTGEYIRSRRGVERKEGLRRVDPGGDENARLPVREVPRPIQPRQVRRQEMGGSRQGRGHEVPGDHQQAPRWFCHVRHEAHRLGHHVDALQARSDEGPGRGVQSGRHQVLFLSLDHGLAPPRLRSPPRVERRGQGRSELRSLRAIHEGPTQGTDDQLRAAGHTLVRRRMGEHLDAGSRQGSLRLRSRLAAEHHHQQPRGQESERAWRA